MTINQPDDLEIRALMRAGWTSRRVPPMSAASWDSMLGIIGAMNYVVAAQIVRDDGTRRGRLLISPRGREVLAEWQAAQSEAFMNESSEAAE